MCMADRFMLLLSLLQARGTAECNLFTYFAVFERVPPKSTGCTAIFWLTQLGAPRHPLLPVPPDRDKSSAYSGVLLHVRPLARVGAIENLLALPAGGHVDVLDAAVLAHRGLPAVLDRPRGVHRQNKIRVKL